MAEGDGVDGGSGGVASRTVFLSYASRDTEVAEILDLLAKIPGLTVRGNHRWI